MSASRSPDGPASRRRRLVRIDIAVGVGAALILILAAPGLAITALVAIGVLLVCGASLAFERARSGVRSRSRRRGRP